MFRASLLSAVCLIAAGDLRAGETVDYSTQIKPIFRSRCYSCHGALKQESGLRLDTGKLARTGGDSGSVVVPQKIGESLLIERVSAVDESERMPPEGKPLTPDQISLLKAWVTQGADSPEDEQPVADPRSHWAFNRPVRPEVPAVSNTDWIRNPIDAFIAAEHERHGLTSLVEADGHVLLRRVYLDLIGLPPARSELHEFLMESSRQTYESVVEDLLGRPQHGERWARHWMDVWRYSDWYGRRNVNDVRNSYPHIWRWRDWIIRSLNDDKGYDRMVMEMLAADEIAPTDDEAIVATGFIVRNWFSLNYDQWMRDLVEHTGKAFLGLRLNCALCHDHKYDPISQEEYFRFRAFFEPLEFRHDRVPGGPALTKYIRYRPGSGTALNPIEAGIARIYDEYHDADTRMYKLGDQRDVFEDKPPTTPGTPAILGGSELDVNPIQLPSEAWYPGLKAFTQDAEIQQRNTALQKVENDAAKGPPLTDLRQKLESAHAARNSAKQHLETVLSEAAADENQCRSVPRSVTDIGYWRFEGADDAAGFLADSSGNGHTLVRVNGNDPPATPFATGTETPGRTFLNPIPASGAANLQAAKFQQRQSFAYLAAPGSPDFYANQLTLEACVHFSTCAKNFNRTIVDYGGSWTLLHRGIDDTQFELRLLCTDADGRVRDVSTARVDPPLILLVGADYFVSVTIDGEHLSFYVKRLDQNSELLTAKFDRSDGEHSFAELARPGDQTQFKIGNSDGTGRVDGLIDEVRYSRGAISAEELAAALLGTPEQQARSLLAAAANEVRFREYAVALAEKEITLAEAGVHHARLQLEAVKARIYADNVRFQGLDGDGEQAARSASQAEWLVAQAAAALQLADAEKAVAGARSKLALGTATSDELKKAEKQVTDAANALKSTKEPRDSDSSGYAALGPKYPETSTGRRAALARWIASERNPVTARVAVNHIWMRHFGRPLVETVSDLGRSGKAPTHPRLLDWLAVEFMESGWSMKHIHRLIVTSNTYRMCSNVRDLEHPNLAADQDNRFWWRFERKRMEAELLRDSLLYTSGHLDMTIGGQEIDNNLGPTVPRRSMYFSRFPEGGGTMPFLELFDAPDTTDCYRRTESIVPQQALAMSNSHITLNYGRKLGETLWASVEEDGTERTKREEAFIIAAFEQILSRRPSNPEQQRCELFLYEQRVLFESTDAAALKGTAMKNVQPASPESDNRAREGLIRVLFSHNDFITIH